MTRHLTPQYLMLVLLLLFTEEVMAQTDYIYSTFDPAFETQLSLSRIPASSVNSLDTSLETTPSPYESGQFWLESANFSQPAPWHSTLFIQQDGKVLSLYVRNHANVTPQATWVNEELVHVRLWWGRAVGSELLIDVTRNDFLYRRMVYWTPVLATTGTLSTDIPNFSLRLAHIQGSAPLGEYSSIQVERIINADVDLEEATITFATPMFSECMMTLTYEQTAALYQSFEQLLTERSDNAPPRPRESVCRNCTIYDLSWQHEGEQGSFVFSEEQPYRYPALDTLVPLLEELNDDLEQAVCSP
ncbi:MAG: hypothetical protein AAF267_05855 [Deinococcota bacterium]